MLWTLGPLLALALTGSRRIGAEDVGSRPDGGSLADWQYFVEIEPPDEGDSPWTDVVLAPGVFDASRHDLADLRLRDASGGEISYALRERREEDRKDTFEAKEFNRVQGPDKSTELSLDLGEKVGEHNEVEVELPGINFRRRGELEGSDDGEKWGELVKKNLVRFKRGDEELEDRRFNYPPCRFRYLRLRVFPDPLVDKKAVPLGKVTVGRRVEVPGETVKLPARLEPRNPDRERGANASAWIIDLGADNVPCEGIEVEIDEAEFVRDYRIEAAGPPEAGPAFGQEFRRVGSGRWRRRAGEPPAPMEAELRDVRPSRLKLIVIDHANPPLNIRSVKYTAPARQVVFARPEKSKDKLRLYFGHPKAEAPNYDFARNLPARLDPLPLRAKLGPRQENPSYVPELLPFTERWPWAIYVALGGVSVVLAGIIFSVGRKAIAVCDAAEVAEPTEAPAASSAPPPGSPFETEEGLSES
jgi:hypothetical protein